jgi:hypothetical protein
MIKQKQKPNMSWTCFSWISNANWSFFTSGYFQIILTKFLFQHNFFLNFKIIYLKWMDESNLKKIYLKFRLEYHCNNLP